ncbi:GOLD domain [Babesia duncani]|uniref:GOLD domain n=1 Tax=Babesia duncani TaxID=323732 RepID=A0AAD9PKY3_9APIC|nr:GOLD domain [Babesia duncani]
MSRIVRTQTCIWTLCSIFAFCLFKSFTDAVYLETTTLIEPYTTLCLSEFIGTNTYTHITVSGVSLPQDKGLKVVVKEQGSEKPVYSESNIKRAVSISFTTIHGNAVICCVSAPDVAVHVAFSIKSGADARDYSIIAKSTHLDPIDGFIQNALDEFVAFHKAQVAGRRSIDKTSAQAAKTFFLLTKFAIANSIFIILTTFVYIIYFRSFFMTKKVI